MKLIRKVRKHSLYKFYFILLTLYKHKSRLVLYKIFILSWSRDQVSSSNMIFTYVFILFYFEYEKRRTLIIIGFTFLVSQTNTMALSFETKQLCCSFFQKLNKTSEETRLSTQNIVQFKWLLNANRWDQFKIIKPYCKIKTKTVIKT